MFNLIEDVRRLCPTAIIKGDEGHIYLSQEDFGKIKELGEPDTNMLDICVINGEEMEVYVWSAVDEKLVLHHTEPSAF